MSPTPHSDCSNIVTRFASDFTLKYHQGQKEHGSQFWSASAGSYLREARNEALDLVAYLHHLEASLERIQSVASALRDGSITNIDAADQLQELALPTPPKSF